MVAIDIRQADESKNEMESCQRTLECLREEAGEIQALLGTLSGMEDVRMDLARQMEEMWEEIRALRQMRECLQTGIFLYTSREAGLADHVEEVQVLDTLEIGEWITPEWAFGLLG